MRRFAAVLLASSLTVPGVSLGADEAPMAGYSKSSSQNERDWETKFRAIPDTGNLREFMRRMSARPHHVGSPYDKDNAEWILAQFKEWGFDAHIETFDVLFPTPKERALEMVEPTRFTAKLEEPALPADPTSTQTIRAAAHLQRLLDRWRRDRAAGLREFRHSGGLREARSPGHFGEGRDRDRQVRRILARHQAQGGGRARRGRLPDLFRPARRWLHARRRLPEGSVAQPRMECSAAA